jgi:hypothetical protein
MVISKLLPVRRLAAPLAGWASEKMLLATNGRGKVRKAVAPSGKSSPSGAAFTRDHNSDLDRSDWVARYLDVLSVRHYPDKFR